MRGCNLFPLKEFLRLVHGSQSTRRPTAMLVSFNDDSGTHNGAKVILLCGFLADGDEWVKIDQPWEEVIHKPGWPSVIKAFHNVDCVAGDGEFRGWSYAQRLAMLGDLVSVIISLPLMAIGAAVIVD